MSNANRLTLFKLLRMINFMSPANRLAVFDVRDFRWWKVGSLIEKFDYFFNMKNKRLLMSSPIEKFDFFNMKNERLLMLLLMIISGGKKIIGRLLMECDKRLKMERDF